MTDMGNAVESTTCAAGRPVRQVGMPAVELLNSETMLTKILLTHTTNLNTAFKLALAITPKLTKVHK